VSSDFVEISSSIAIDGGDRPLEPIQMIHIEVHE